MSVLKNRKMEPIPTDVSELTEINLDQELAASVLRYDRRTFILNLEKYPRNHVRNQALEVSVHATAGDPDLYISVAEPPTEKEYLWRSCMDGRDMITIHPEDPNYRIGIYYIAVSDASTDCSFKICARLVQPTSHNDGEIFGHVQQGMYHSIKSGIQVSEHRRRLCAVGKITSLSSSLKRVPVKQTRASGHGLLPASPVRAEIRAQSQCSVDSDSWTLPMLERKKKVQIERR